MLLTVDLFDFNPETKTYCEELSVLQHKLGGRVGPICGAPAAFIMRDCPEPGMYRSFTLSHVDRSGGDIAGWNYTELEGPNHSGLKVLIIND
jgi:hypothetical protein